MRILHTGASLILALALTGPASASIVMPESVISSGGGEIGAADKIIRGTVCQDAIGIVTSASYKLEIGFWHELCAIVTDVPPTPEWFWGLAQNHPNPFNPLTKISYTLPSDLRVSLKIFDLRGKMIRTLRDQLHTAGAHVAVWDGRDAQGERVASGTYFARLESEEGILTRKMTLIK